MEEQEKEGYGRGLIKRAEQTQRLIFMKSFIKTLLEQKVKTHYSNLEPKLRGFILLFSLYWYNLFNNDQSLEGEAGLKKYIPIMSRVPLSCIYWYCLSDEGRQKFQSIFDPIIQNFGESFCLRSYTCESSSPGENNYVDQRTELLSGLEKYRSKSFSKNSSPTLSLKEWYQSIIKNDKDLDGNIKPDLLSPPPGLIPIDNIPYAMGALPLLQGDIPIFEVRGFGLICHGHIDKVIDSINIESEWFFNKLN